MKKRFLLSLLAIMAYAIQTSASYTLAVRTADGRQQRIALNEYPVITIHGGELKIESASTSLSFAIQTIVDFKYLSEEASVGSECISDGITHKGDKLIFNADIPLTVSVYDISGNLFLNEIIPADKESIFELSQLGKGVYIVNVNNVSFKIIR